MVERDLDRVRQISRKKYKVVFSVLSKHSHILLKSQGYLLHFEDECTLKMRDVNDMSRSRKKTCIPF